MIKKTKITPASKLSTPFIVRLSLCGMIGMLLAPFSLFGEEATTYDKTTIRYPSMFVGQIWAKSGEPSAPSREAERGQIPAKSRENASARLKTNSSATDAAMENNSSPATARNPSAAAKEPAPGNETKKKLKQKRLKTVQALKERNAQKTATNSTPSMPVPDREVSKASEDGTLQIKKTASSRSTAVSVSGVRRPGKSWHSKQELYDVECGQKLARVVVTYYFDKEKTLISSRVTPDAQWYHIYPGSLEEKLYVELCHPSMY